MRKAIFVVGLHGDEKMPVLAIKKFSPPVEFLVANKLALKKGKRFIEKDLNRVFPGKENGDLEERLAKKILKKLKRQGRRVVIDIHTSSCSTPPFVVITRRTKRHLFLASRTGIERVVFMKKTIASGKALIDHISLGISLEVGKEGLKKTDKMVFMVVKNILQGKREPIKEQFEVFAFLKKINDKETLVKSIKPFEEIKKGALISQRGNKKRYAGVSFFPVLPRTRNYPRTLCLMAKKC